jgi:hypothetical protein
MAVLFYPRDFTYWLMYSIIKPNRTQSLFRTATTAAAFSALILISFAA